MKKTCSFPQKRLKTAELPMQTIDSLGDASVTIQQKFHWRIVEP
jgi:hypothetical protein